MSFSQNVSDSEPNLKNTRCDRLVLHDRAETAVDVLPCRRVDTLELRGGSGHEEAADGSEVEDV